MRDKALSLCLNTQKIVVVATMAYKEYATITSRTLFIYVSAQAKDGQDGFKSSRHSIKIEVLVVCDDTSYHPI